MLDIPDKVRNEREDAELAAIRAFFEDRRREPFGRVANVVEIAEQRAPGM